MSEFIKINTYVVKQLPIERPLEKGAVYKVEQPDGELITYTVNSLGEPIFERGVTNSQKEKLDGLKSQSEITADIEEVRDDFSRRLINSESGAVKVDGDILPTLDDANKRYSFTTGSAGRTLTWTNPVNSQVVPFSFGANKQCSAFWDGVSKTWVKEDEVELPVQQSINNLNQTVSGSPLDAAQGKILNEKIESIINYTPTWLPYGIKEDGSINTGDTLQHFDFMPAAANMKIESFNGDLYRINIYDVNQNNIARTDFLGGNSYTLPNDIRIAYIRASSVSAGGDPNAPNPRTVRTIITNFKKLENSLTATNNTLSSYSSSIEANRSAVLQKQDYINPNATIVNFLPYVQNGSLDGTGNLVPSDTRRAIFKLPIVFGKSILIKNNVDRTSTTKRVVLYNASNTVTRTFNQTDQSNLLITPTSTEVFLSITLIAPPNDSKVNEITAIHIFESLNNNEPTIDLINGLKVAGFDQQVRTSPLYYSKPKLSTTEAYISVLNGKTTNSPGFKPTDYIAVFEGQRIKGKARLYGNSGICGYPSKSDATFTALFTPTGSVNEFDITIPIGSGIKYIRLATQTTVIPEIELDYSYSYNYELFASVGVTDDLSIQNLLFKGGQVETQTFINEAEKTVTRWLELKDNYDFPTNGVYIGQRNGEVVVSVNGVVQKIQLV